MSNHYDKKLARDQETEANLFAMCLLMPEAMVRHEVKKLLANSIGFDVCDDQRIRQLARKFQVTEQLMTLRLHQLGFLGV